jgi:predicted lipoprotein with Yx(FWY)xxD motif
MTIAMTRPALALSAFMFSAVGAQGAVLTAQNGMTLYVFDKDKGDQSVCYDDCAVNWPPYVGTAVENMRDVWNLVPRTDGTMQLTDDGEPV